MALIIINGRLGGRPEQKNSKNGTAYLSFSVAHSEKRGEKEETVWYRCLWINWEKNGLVSYLEKGSLVSVIGKLQKPKAFQRKDGSSDVDLTVFVNDVSFLPSSKADRVEYASSASVHAPAGKANDLPNDELPF
jgi:single-strand DNA-binding protein